MNAETESLVCYLDEQRDSMLQIVDGLPEAALRRAVFPSGWTCLGLARHLAVDDERNWFRGVAAGEPVDFPAGEDPGWLVGPEAAAGEVCSAPTVGRSPGCHHRGDEGDDMDPLIDRREYSGLANCTYLNQASLGLIPRVSLEASVRFLTGIAQHGNLRLSDQAEAEILDTLRAAAAELLGAPVASVAVVGGASEGLGQLAAMLSGPDGEVILVPSDFPSVTYPWLAAHERSGMRIRWVPDVAAKDLTQSLVAAISERTTVLCVSAVQFSTGTQVDIAALAAHARSAGARVVADVTQMAGAVPVTMTAWGADALVCSGYKWLSAPGGVALLAVTEDLAAAIPPLVGWKGSATPFDFKPQELSLAGDARRFELSTMSYSAASGLLASIKLLTGIGLNSIREHAGRLAASLVERTAPLGWTPYRPLSDQSASGHIVSLRHPTAAVDEVQAALANEHKIITSSRGGGIRVSLHAYNSDDDVRALSEALESTGRRKNQVWQ